MLTLVIDAAEGLAVPTTRRNAAAGTTAGLPASQREAASGLRRARPTADPRYAPDPSSARWRRLFGWLRRPEQPHHHDDGPRDSGERAIEASRYLALRHLR